MIPYSCDTVFECDAGKIDIRPLFVVLSSDLPQARDKCFYRQPNKVNSFKLEEEEKIPTSPTPSNQNPAQALSRLVRAAPVNVQVIIRVWWEVGEVYKKDG